MKKTTLILALAFVLPVAVFAGSQAEATTGEAAGMAKEGGLPPGQYYEFQLIGLTVSNEAGLILGTLEEILETPGNHVFVIRGTSGEHLLPATKEVVRSVDLDAGSMTVRWAADMMETADAV